MIPPTTAKGSAVVGSIFVTTALGKTRRDFRGVVR
jgi:hypothetical protein